MHRLAPLVALGSLTFLACSGDGGGDPDAGTPDSGLEDVEVCPGELPAAPSGAACAVTAGDGRLFLQGDVVVPGGVKQGGGVLVGAGGKIACAGCGCATEAAGATTIACPGSTIAPGFINAHDHITFTGATPQLHSERYEHRHDWRKGKGGHTKIGVASTPKAVSWGELRQVIAGATSLIGSGGEKGLVRNLDGNADLQEGLGKTPVKYSTFPLGDSDGTQLTNGCNYPKIDDPNSGAIAATASYVPHVAEGIDPAANNEFTCVSGLANAPRDLVIAKSAFIHGVGLKPQDYALMANDGTGLIWSPRSNIDLYGMTAEVTTAARAGVEIALGTDWTASGSMNTLRELRCADALNQNQYHGFFSDRALLDMATSTAARLAAVDDVLGTLEAGKFADIAVFAGGRANAYRNVLAAEAKDVVLVLRAGKALFGEGPAVDAIGADGCEAMDVCGASRKVCVQRETGKTLAALKSASGNVYDLFFCEAPKNEPSCVPVRPGEFTGVSSPDDVDGDGIANANDNCPDVFNPVRPIDADEKQGDADGDGRGDACDLCATSKDDASCPKPRFDDVDLDGVADATDNCKHVSNADQKDTDQDDQGDACDACPTIANGEGEPCPATIYEIKANPRSVAVAVPEAVVTAVGALGYFMQHEAGSSVYAGADRSGIFVYTGRDGAKPAVNARISVKGTVSEYFGQVQLSTASFTVKAENVPAPEPLKVQPSDVATDGPKAEALEGVLVKVEGVTVSNASPEPDDSETPPTNEFELTGGLRVNDYLYLVSPLPAQGDTFRAITGVLRWGNNNSKLEPRSEADVVRRPALQALELAVPFVPVGSKATVTVRLTAPAEQDTKVTLSSSAANALSVPADVTIPANAATATFEATALAAAEEPIVITGKYEEVTKTLGVRPYDPAAPRKLAAFTSDVSRLAPGQSAQLKLALDLPAATGGTKVQLAADPAGVVELSTAEVTIAEGAFEGTATAAHVAPGTVKITATLGEVTKDVQLEVTAELPPQAPQPGDLVITEIMANPKLAGADEAHEWFELFNAAAHPVVLTGVVLEDNGAKHTVATADLVLAAGEYGVFACKAAAADNGGLTPIYAYGSASACPLKFANGGDFLRLSLGTVELDKVTWGSGNHASAEARSMCLKFPYGDNANKDSWGDTPAAVTYSTTDAGSPGAASTADNCK